MKYSKQRELVLKILQENVVHPTADTLYEMIKKEMPSISLATVYRNLNLLAENGLISKVEGVDGVQRFDHNLHPHYHFICTKCNKVYDIPHDIAPDLLTQVNAKTGLIVESCELSCKGICNDCRSKLN